MKYYQQLALAGTVYTMSLSAPLVSSVPPGAIRLLLERDGSGTPSVLRVISADPQATSIADAMLAALPCGEVVVDRGRLVDASSPFADVFLEAWRAGRYQCSTSGYLATAASDLPFHYSVTHLGGDYLIAVISAHPEYEPSSPALTAGSFARLLAAHLLAKEKFHVIIADVDGLAMMNKAWGAAAGDKVLRSAYERISALVPPGSVVSPSGSDEFYIFLPQSASAEVLCSGILTAVAAPVRVQGSVVCPSVSLGCSSAADAPDAASILSAADLALYEAKTSGKSRAVFYKDVSSELSKEVLNFASVHTALHLDQFDLHYQPIFDTSTLAARGVEALLRWNHPTRGVISPDEFMSSIHAGNLISDVGEWVVRRAVASAALIPGALEDGYKVCINIDPLQLTTRDLVGHFSAALAEYGANASNFSFEIVETDLLTSGRDVLDKLNALAQMGVQVAIDDFGSGTAGFAYLRDFPIQVVKVDRSMVSPLPSAREVKVLQGIVSMCHSLGIEVILEGVETKAQLDAALLCDVDAVQGFLLAPVSALLPAS